MKILFNKTFFRFLLGFSGIVALGIVGIAIVGLQTLETDQTASAEQSATP